ncbi:MAG TPA: hypothetical protein VNW99_13905 [Cytophagaceae bacterium]|jgi:hypothetical protein|nr:hypothetical protein [Cytophagaceae bacterium]
MKTYKHPHLLYALGFIHALYFMVIGIWPVVDMNSFMFFTGAKTDIWMAKALGLLMIIIGLLLISAIIRNKLIMELILLIIFSALALAGVEFYYGWNDMISEIYLLDAAAEFFFILCWILLLLTKPGKNIQS